MKEVEQRSVALSELIRAYQQGDGVTIQETREQVLQYLKQLRDLQRSRLSEACASLNHDARVCRNGCQNPVERSAVKTVCKAWGEYNRQRWLV